MLIRMICRECCYVYDPDYGDERGIPPGIPFEGLPDEWKCPVCQAEKDKFGSSMEFGLETYPE